MKLDTSKHFFLPEDQHLFDYDYIFSASAMWVDLGMEDVEATFDLFVRDLPKRRNFLLLNGLEEMISGILDWSFTDEEVDFLLSRKIITPKIVPLLRKFKFVGDVMAMPEGSIFFAQEPVLRITGKLWEINLMTFFLMNALSSNTIFSSKIVRSFLAARNKIYVATCSPVRGHAHEAALKFGRSAYILGSASGMVPGFARKYNIPYESKARAFHAFIKSFSTEIEALRACASIFPNSSVMVDTYDTNQGIENIITVCKEQKTKKLPVFSAVFIDSGKNLKAFINQAKMIRRKLDQNGLKEVQITVAGNFEEYKIDQLVKKKAPIDKVIMGTELVAPSDDPKVEVVLKMAQFVKNGEVHSTAKLATGKVSYPGLKQVFRKYKNGIMDGDTIGLEVERPGTPLLIDYIKSGKLVREMPTLDQIKEFTFAQLETLPEMLKRVDKEFNYDVKFSDGLDQLLAEARRVHQSKHL